MKKNWVGNLNGVYKTLGSSNHTDKQKEINDFYATDPKAGKLLLELETFSKNIWECACGKGHLTMVFENAGYNVKSTDLIYRGFGQGGVHFLSDDIVFWNGDIITNPPYKYAKQFVEKALSIIPEGNKVAMFLRLLFLEGKARKKLFMSNPPKIIYVSSSRISCAKNGNFDEKINETNNAVAFASFIWEKGFNGVTQIKWFN